MKNIITLVVALLLILGLSAGTVMANGHELSDDDYELEQAVGDGEDDGDS